MGHIYLRKMNYLIHHNLVEGVNVKGFHLNEECLSCKFGKQKKKSHPSKQVNSINLPLERLHMDLFGPVNVKSVTGEFYCLVVTDDYSRFSWVMFLEHKDETFDYLMVLFKKLENLYKLPIRRIRSDNGTEFKNNKMLEYCNEHGVLHEFSAPYTPQQNGVAERKNRTIIETARTMLSDSKLPVNFWTEAVASAVYTLNRVLIVKKHGKTCFELLNRRKPNLKWLEPFGTQCTVLDPDGKFGAKSLEGYFVGYASPLRRVFIPSMNRIVQAHNVDCQSHTKPVQKPGDQRLFDYENLWNSFNLPEQPSESELNMLFQQLNDDDIQRPVYDEPIFHESQPENEEEIQLEVPVAEPVFDDDGEPGHDEVFQNGDESEA